jgi:hypothetical protein
MLTFFRGRFELVSLENEHYHLDTSVVKKLALFFPLVAPWTKVRPERVAVGPYLVEIEQSGRVHIPVTLASGKACLLPVATEWLRLMVPLFLHAFEIVECWPSGYARDFSLERDPLTGEPLLSSPDHRKTRRDPPE